MAFLLEKGANKLGDCLYEGNGIEDHFLFCKKLLSGELMHDKN